MSHQFGIIKKPANTRKRQYGYSLERNISARPKTQPLFENAVVGQQPAPKEDYSSGLWSTKPIWEYVSITYYNFLYNSSLVNCLSCLAGTIHQKHLGPHFKREKRQRTYPKRTTTSSSKTKRQRNFCLHGKKSGLPNGVKMVH